MKLPKLYHRASKGDLRSWEVWTEEDEVVTSYGVVDGAKQEARYKALPKNVGKKNETSPKDQAESEARSLWQHKLDRKYSETPEEAQVESFMPMLAKDFNPKKIVYPSIIQKKLDGVRALASWDGDRVILMSRSNKEWTVPKHINKALETILPKDSMFDGELYVHGLECQKINSLVNKERPETHTVEYWVYDYPIVQGKENLTNKERAAALTDCIIKTPFHSPIKYVPSLSVINEDMRKQYEANNLQEGYEGSILRNPEGLYKFGYRSIDLMKLKEFEDHEFVVLSVGEGKGKMLGHAVFNCKNDINDEEFEVTPALPMEEKKKMFDNPQDYIGKLLTVKHFGRTGAPELKPRFPVGKMFRDEKDLSR